MARNRMDDFGVTVDPRTGELRTGAPLWRAMRRPRGNGSGWRRWALGFLTIVLASLLGLFTVALVSELM